MNCKRLICALLLGVSFATPVMADSNPPVVNHVPATPVTAIVVSACGTPPSTYTPGDNRLVTQDITGTLCTPGTSGAPSTVVPLFSVPVPYTSNTVMDFRSYGSILLDCPTAPSAIVFNVSPDAANAANVGTTTALIHPIALTAVQNNAATGFTVTGTGAAIAEWSVTGNKFAAFTITGGACWISGSNS